MGITVSNNRTRKVTAHYTVKGVLTSFADEVEVPFDYMTGEVIEALNGLLFSEGIKVNGTDAKVTSVFLIIPKEV